MRLELAERLRCPGAHAPTPLIVVAQETVERDLRRAIVGCAVCGLEARIASGTLTFPDGRVVAGAGRGAPEVDTAALERLVALLHLDAPGGAVLLAGGYARFAVALEAACEVHAVVLASAHEDVHHGAHQERHHDAPWIPFTDATFRAAAVAGLPSALLGDLARVVTPGGRIVAEAGVEPPAGTRLLARDDREWVAESAGGGGGMVELRRTRAEG